MHAEIKEHSGKSYKVVNGTWYHRDTRDEIIEILENARLSCSTLRVHYGDVNTGKDWLESFDVTGHIGRSMGPVKIPLLIKQRNSRGGPGLLEHCIVKVRTIGRNATVLYMHPHYNVGKFEVRACSDKNGYEAEVLVGGSVHARFQKVGQAEQWVRKMAG